GAAADRDPTADAAADRDPTAAGPAAVGVSAVGRPAAAAWDAADGAEHHQSDAVALSAERIREDVRDRQPADEHRAGDAAGIAQGAAAAGAAVEARRDRHGAQFAPRRHGRPHRSY